MDFRKLLTLLYDPVIAAYFSGTATIIAVLLALFLERYFEHRRRPKLSVEFDRNQKGDLRYLPPPLAGEMREGEEREEMWIRLRVKNTSGTPARDVEVRFICTQRERSTIRENRPSWWFKISNLNAVSLTIPPKFTQYFDLAYVKNIQRSPEDISFYLAIVHGDLPPWTQEKVRIESDMKNNKLDLGWTYDLFFAVVSSNADAKYYRMRVKVAPKKTDDPALEELLGEDRLKVRIKLDCPQEVTPKEAFPRKVSRLMEGIRRIVGSNDQPN
jgi:hypothetical protein